MMRGLLVTLAGLIIIATNMAAPAGASTQSHPWPGIPALPFPHLRDGNNSPGNETDTTPPTLAVTSHKDREIVKEASITLRGTVSDASGIRAVEVRVNGGPWASVMGNELWYLPIKLEEGSNSILVRASDTAGNDAERNLSIVLSISIKDNLGIILAAALIIPVVAILLLFVLRRKAPPKDRPGDHDELEKRLGLAGKQRDDSGSSLDDSEEVTRIDERPAKTGSGKAKR